MEDVKGRARVDERVGGRGVYNNGLRNSRPEAVISQGWEGQKNEGAESPRLSERLPAKLPAITAHLARVEGEGEGGGFREELALWASSG